jgi:hypothetical protein
LVESSRPSGQFGPTLSLLFVYGTLLAVVCDRTGSPFVAVGIQAFVNTPTMLVGSPDAGVLTADGVGVPIAAFRPRVRRVTHGVCPHGVDDSDRQPSG